MLCKRYSAYEEAMEEARWIYTGRELRRTVTYVLPGGDFGIDKDYCVLGIAPASVDNG